MTRINSKGEYPLGYKVTMDDLKKFNVMLSEIADYFKMPCCATTDAHFLEPQDAMYRKNLLTAIGFTDSEQAELYFRTTDEMLEEFSYNGTTNKYGESLENWETNGSPFLKDRFANETLSNGKSFLSYAVPYFWGTMGFTYDSNYFSADDVGTWECLWSNDSHFHEEFSLKNSMRDTYVAAIFHVYKDEISALDI